MCKHDVQKSGFQTKPREKQRASRKEKRPPLHAAFRNFRDPRGVAKKSLTKNYLGVDDGAAGVVFGVVDFGAAGFAAAPAGAGAGTPDCAL